MQALCSINTINFSQILGLTTKLFYHWRLRKIRAHNKFCGINVSLFLFRNMFSLVLEGNHFDLYYIQQEIS